MSSSLKDRAYAFIREKIVTGVLPPGERISDLEISKEMGVSRTPVREALAHLETQGLVEQEPGFGPKVRRLSREELVESFELREILECGAAAIAAQRITDAELGELSVLLDEYEATVKQVGEDCNHGPLNWRLSVLDIAFHLKIIEAVKNQSLLRAVGDIQLLTGILQRRADVPTVPHAQRLDHVCSDHREILRALEARDPALAIASLQKHLRWARDFHLEAFDWEQRSQTR
ncbi:MAG TPA: GntR family transcriptional regulator, partial [Planctomycetota bacterium]|nr:GntR family transcriptional regulator [Planctomycetota bacterium]